MILRGLNKAQLQRCLDSCQKLYDNNLIFNRFDSTGYKKNVRGIKTAEMEGAVIFTRVNGKALAIPIHNRDDPDYRVLPNPFVKNQVYYIVKNGMNTYITSIYYRKNGKDIFYMDSYSQEPRYVIDFLKNNINPTQITFTLKVRDCKKAGHRLGYPRLNLDGEEKGKQRRMSSACWHVHRDVMIAIFDMNPNAKLKTSMIYYKGKEHFYDTFEETGKKNVGSQMFPVTLPELCDCGYA